MADETDLYGQYFEPLDLSKDASRARDQALYDAFFESKNIPEPTFADKMKTVGQGTTAGAIKTTTTVAGAVMGGKIGAVAGAATGPFAEVAAPVLGAVGAISGGVAGYMAGDAIQSGLAKVYLPGYTSPLVYENLEAVPLQLRPYAIAGENFGGAIPFAGAPYIASRAGIKFADNLVGRWLNGIVHSAERAPVAFALAEANMAFGAGVGAGTAAALYPDSAKAEMAGAMIGGTLSPGAWAVKVARLSASGLRAVVQQIPVIKNMPVIGVKATAQQKAGQFLRDLVTQFGEDPQELIRRLAAADSVLGDQPLTAGQKTGSKALLELEAKMTQLSAQFGGEAEEMGNTALKAMRNMVELLHQTGDPQALKMAAEVERNYFTTMLEGQKNDANRRVMEAMAALDPNNAVSRSEFGVKAANIIDRSMRQVRNVESQLWEAVPKDGAVALENTVRRYGDIRGRLLPEESLPPVVEKFIARMQEQAETTAGTAFSNVGEMLTFRSRMLALAREAAAKNEWSDASAYGQLAEAALDDLGSAIAGTEGEAALEAARAWSRQLHETFSQTFAGDVLQATAEGGTRLPPELVMLRALGSGREMGALQFRQLQEASRMAGQQFVAEMTDVQRQTLQYAANELFVNGKVNPGRLATWTAKNRELLAMFPEVREQLRTVEKAQKFFEETEAGVAATQRSIKQDAAFVKVLDAGEDPAVAVGKAIEGNNPISDINAIWVLARKGGADAQAGAQAALWRYVYDKAVSKAGDFSFDIYRQILEGRPTPSAPPLKDILTNAGFVPQDHMNQVMTLLTRATELERAMAAHTPLDKVLPEMGPGKDFVIRWMATKLANRLPGQHNSLVVSAAMSRSARQIFDRIPKDSMKEALIHALRDPKLMAVMLEQSSDPKVQMRWALQMNAYLWQLGIGGWDRPQEEKGYEE